ncbi:MAG: hypothetical protein IJ191_07550 [Treponema sp.]|nr:hypothetical protein [Treponema sp.]
MDMAVLEKKVSSLSVHQQENVESYIDFLVYKNSLSSYAGRKPLDFSKYGTATHLWNDDAQNFVNRLRQDERF